MINYKDKEYVCHLDWGFELIRGKWKAVLLCHLSEGSKRFLELQRITGNVSQKVLNEQLKQLEEDGFITKTIYPEVPPRVEYNLTEKGNEIVPALKIVESWSIKHFPDSKKESE
ncbi:winged helix-turn-helix transcriptional regulator [Clostridium pasteurianum]|uniref:Putative transcriptional regulator n=1 Tax=Clostridium pasteurianum BC1 TaxID=86416 RepID=R4K6F8_CLOPA|nr:helix-turn-helix domain-containing protein [Clostridium pasteurianum]AGK98777.1 putative transcriptional regulator [Clostridium pasteurianum BC1]